MNYFGDYFGTCKPLPPDDPAQTTILFSTKDFLGEVLANVPITLTLNDDGARAVVINGSFRQGRSFSGVTDESGVCVLAVWDYPTLTNSKLRPVYALTLEGTDGVKLRAPTNNNTPAQELRLT